MDQEKVGSFIKKLRQDNNLTQAEFANKLGVTYQAVSKWENGKNVPDIATMKEISNLFNVNIDEIISGKKNNKNNKNIIIVSIIAILLFIFILLLVIHILNNKDNDSFKFKVINTTCDNFTINGSLAYNKDKSYIYISNIDFCGDEEIIYDTIECVLYEKNGDILNKITSCHIGHNETLKNHLKNVKLSGDNYKTICSDKSRELYLEINATVNNKTTTYKIPLEISDTCDK